jgi:hypothetical protein
MVNSDLRIVGSSHTHVKEGMNVSPGAGLTLNISEGVVDVKHSAGPKYVAADTSIAVAAPAGSGNVVRNYLRMLNSAPGTYSVFRTAEGVAITALDLAGAFMDADVNAVNGDGENHYLYTYLGYCDVAFGDVAVDSAKTYVCKPVLTVGV